MMTSRLRVIIVAGWSNLAMMITEREPNWTWVAGMPQLKTKAKPSWWTAVVGNEVIYKGEKATISYIGRNKGEDTIIKLIIATRKKAKQVRMKEVSW